MELTDRVTVLREDAEVVAQYDVLTLVAKEQRTW